MPDDLEFWEFGGDGSEEQTLANLINRVLDRGVVIVGEITISVAGIDLIYLGLNAVLTSVGAARETLHGRGHLPSARRRDEGAV